MLEVYNYITANTIIPSALELIEKGWVDLLRTGVVSVATTGQLVWNTGSAGHKLVTEDNSAGIKDTVVDANNQLRYLNPISALRADGMDTYSNTEFTTKRTTGTTITLSSGAIAATELVALVAGKILWPEQIDIYLSPAAGLAVDGSALIEIEDSAATPITLGECAIGLGNPFVSLTNLKRGTVAKAINLVATAGGTSLGGSKLVVRVHYKELS